MTVTFSSIIFLCFIGLNQPLTSPDLKYICVKKKSDFYNGLSGCIVHIDGNLFYFVF